jgi:thymidylate kinase
VIVELIGCDGAGKTMLSRMLCEHPLLEGRAVRMADLLLDRPGLRRITHPTAVNVVQEVSGLPFVLRAYRRRHGYIAFSRRMHARYAPSRYHRLNGMRGIVRRVGMYELARARAVDRIVLSDEGTVLSAYLFALTDVELDPSDLERFAQLVPRPDRIVYVKAPVASLVQRATTRRDPRRQHIGRNREQVERTIRRTVDVFDLVAEAAPLRDRVLVVENEGGDSGHVRLLVDDIARALRETPGGDDVRTRSAPPVSPDELRAEPRH